MNTVIIAEKPSQAKSYADAFHKKIKRDGYFEIEDPLIGGQAIITWGYGHLVSLEEPAAYKAEWKKWRLNELPIFPETFRFTVPSDKRKQFNVVKTLLKKADQIIVATDSDREGENIARSIIKHAGADKKPTKRLWINSLESDVIRSGFESLREGNDYIPLYKEAQTRQMSDWLIGMNLSRLYSLLLQKKGVDGPFSVGRVQTPTLYMIWQRQHEIEHFKPEPYFDLYAKVESPEGSFQAKHDKRFKTEQEALDRLSKHNVYVNERTESLITKAEKKKKKTAAPNLHSLSSLQTKLNRLYKYSPSSVLKTVQDLYEKKIISYPRTDSHFITENEFRYLKNQLDKMKASAGASFENQYNMPRKKYVQNDKVQEHYALIPTKKILTQQQIAALSPKERNVYLEVLRSVLAMFHDDYHYEETKIEVSINDLIFKASGNVELKRGWKELFGPEKKEKDTEHQVLPAVSKGQQVEASAAPKEGITKPPKPYTEGDIINMMKTAGKAVEDEESQTILKETEGIGTEATRAAIIETLKNQQYIEINKNIVTVTEKGITLCAVIENTLLSSPEMTAKWELYLKKIGKQQGDQQKFLSSIEKFIHHLIQQAPVKIDSTPLTPSPAGGRSRTGEQVAKCPSCKEGIIKDRGKFYGCSEYAKGCKQTFPKTLLSKKLSPAQIKGLCEKGRTNMIKGFKSKKGKKFSAALLLKDGKIEMEFPHTKTVGSK
ncbi:type IA DNA topoisomerase [Jeotgalibacillus soli]|uniref:DNA topoisomerase n=1 Tax=Jeotgalibacillus soli TaxID=889306 RepID=A0A0C2RQA4_9BACL|nr:type IA DNA topoisomerase [Jeotgalibacillus soli]KIL43929.1 DNA topoisomerase [Jeotgalibacillus soli]